MATSVRTSIDRRIHLLHTTPLCKNVGDSSLRRLADYAMQLQFHAGEALIEEETEADVFYVVLEGHTQVVRKGVDSSPVRTYLAYIGKGDIIGELRLMNGKPHTATVEALSRCNVLKLDFGALQFELTQSAQLNYNLAGILTEKLITNGAQIEILRLKNPGERLIRVLTFIADKFGTDNGVYHEVVQTIGLHHLESMLDTNRTQIMDMLRQLSEAQLIVFWNKFHYVRFDKVNVAELRQLDARTLRC